MKINKKIVNLALALAIALPMSLSTSVLDSYAAGITARYTSTEGSKPVSNVIVAFYEKSETSNTLKKLFTVVTDESGKFKRDSVKSFNNTDITGIIDENGNLNLKQGIYVYMDETPATGYFKNVRPVRLDVDQSGIGKDIDVSVTPIPSGMGQIIITSRGPQGELLQGVTYDLFVKEGSKEVRLASLSTDEDGLLSEGFERTTDLPNITVKVVNGTLVLPAGSYKIISKNSINGLMLQKDGITFKTEASKIEELNLKLTKEGNVSGSTVGNSKTADTGVKIKVISKSNKNGLSNQEIAVYSTDESSKTENIVFVGKTNKDGKLDAMNSSKGTELIDTNGIIELKPGTYYYKLNNYPNAKKHPFKIENGKISEQVLTLNISNGSEVSKVKPKSKSKYTNSSSLNSDGTTKLAKTGFASTMGYSIAGIAMISSGAFMFRRKK